MCFKKKGQSCVQYTMIFIITILFYLNFLLAVFIVIFIINFEISILFITFVVKFP